MNDEPIYVGSVGNDEFQICRIKEAADYRQQRMTRVGRVAAHDQP